MKIKRTHIISIFVIIIVIYFVFLRNLGDRKLIHEGDRLVIKIEEYMQKNGRLPDSYNDLDSRDIGTNELFYQKIDSINYILWFGTTLGESMIYYSDSKGWEDGYREIKK